MGNLDLGYTDKPFSGKPGKPKSQPARIDKFMKGLSFQERVRLDYELVKLVGITQKVLGEERVPFAEEDFKEPVILVRRLNSDVIIDPEIDFAYPITVYVPLKEIKVNSYLSSSRRDAERLAEAYMKEIGEKFEINIFNPRARSQ